MLNMRYNQQPVIEDRLMEDNRKSVKPLLFPIKNMYFMKAKLRQKCFKTFLLLSVRVGGQVSLFFPEYGSHFMHCSVYLVKFVLCPFVGRKLGEI